MHSEGLFSVFSEKERLEATGSYREEEVERQSQQEEVKLGLEEFTEVKAAWMRLRRGEEEREGGRGSWGGGVGDALFVAEVRLVGAEVRLESCGKRGLMTWLGPMPEGVFKAVFWHGWLTASFFMRISDPRSAPFS